MRLHLLGIPHTITRYEYSHCAFTGKVIRFSPMMRSVGYEVIHYGVEGAESGANEQINVLTAAEQEELMGGRPDPTAFVGNHADVGNPLYRTFNDRLGKLLRENLRPGDAVCLPFGHAHSQATAGLDRNLFPHVETGIGYPTTCETFRVFETHAWYHYHLGKGNTTGHDYNWVIPNYFDVSQWTPCYDPGEYVLYFGRLTEEKGLRIVVEMARYRPDLKFIICGQGDPTPYLTAPNIEYHPPIHGVARSDLLRKAIAVVMPTRYVEPFGGVTVEAQLCGVPVLGSAYGSFTETIEEGFNGYRCHTLGDFLAGLERCEEFPRLQRVAIRAETELKYDMYNLARDYDRVFKQIADIQDKGWYQLRSTIGPITKAVSPDRQKSKVEQEWEKAQKWEKDWWLTNKNLWDEERRKQRVYAAMMHMPEAVNLGDLSVLDVGAGPRSMLLNYFSTGRMVALDPIDYGGEVEMAYESWGVDYVISPAETMHFNKRFDEVWCYNVLQHVMDPKQVMAKMAEYGGTIRLFEWINIPPYQGHLHTITPELIKSCFPESEWTYEVWDVGEMHAAGLEGEFVAAVLKSKKPLETATPLDTPDLNS